MIHRAFKAAFPQTLPVMAGYLFLSLGFGILLSKSGYGAGWAFFMSAGVYAGAMQFVTIDLLLSGASLTHSALITLLVNARHLFYGITMAAAYRDTGRWAHAPVRRLRLCSGIKACLRTGKSG